MNKQTIKRFIPPQLLLWYTNRPWAPYIFDGIYDTYEAAAMRLDSGFSKTDVITYFANRADNIANEGIPENAVRVAFLINYITHSGIAVRVADIGGGGATTYFEIQNRLTHPKNVSWNVFEVDDAVPTIQAYIDAKQASGVHVHSIGSFASDIRGSANEVVLLHIDDALQYIPNPLVFLKQHVSAFDYCFIGKMHTSPTIPTFVTIQTNIPAPCTFLHLEELSTVLAQNGHRIMETTEDSRVFTMKNFEPQYRLDHRRNIWSVNTKRMQLTKV